MKHLFFILILTFPVIFVSAWEPNTGFDTVYIIEDIEFTIDGSTRSFALMIHGEFEKGRELRGREGLREYIALKERLLLDQRVFEEVTVTYLLGERENDGVVPVNLLVYVKDSWNFIVLPVPRYSTSDGFTMSLLARHYNFLGTMSTLRVDFGYTQRGNDRSFNFSIESDTPFQAAGLNWNLTFNHFFNYVLQRPLFYQNVTGLSVQLPWRTTTLTVGVNQFLTFNEEPGPEAAIIYGVHSLYAAYGASELFAAHRIPLGLSVGEFGELTYTPRLSGRINYPHGMMDEVRMPSVTFSHSIGFGRVHWVGNYRRGLSLSIDNAFSWYFDRGDAPFRVSLDGDVHFHWPLAGFLGVSSRLRYRQWWHWSDVMSDGGGWIPHFNAGDALRGILDSNIWRAQDSELQADRMLSLNLDVPVRVLVFQPSEWLDNRSLRLFDFEMHVSPFVDMALLQGPFNNLKDNPDEGTSFSFREMITTAGFEVIVFSGFFRSLQIRASLGYNLGNFRGLFRWDELYIGTSFHY